MIRFDFTIALVLLAVGTPNALAHGVRHGVSEGATVVSATYDDGSPMSFCDVSVFGPDSSEHPYQEGTSDRNGCFAFVPDTNGVWKITVDDGMGHILKARIDVDSTQSRRMDSTRHADRLGGVAVGIGVIFGCFGLYSMLARRLRARTNKSTIGP